MKIDFTKKEYQTLVEMLLTADWVIRSHEEEPREETKPYGELRKKVLAYCKEMGMEDDFHYDPEEGEYFETLEYEERAAHMGFIGEYDEQVFWSQLADRLAQRDLAEQEKRSTEDKVDEEARIVRLFRITARYEDELADHGIENLQLVTKTPQTH